MEESIQDIIAILHSINDFMQEPFWLKYGFWLDIGNLMILGTTLFFLVRYTRATQKMKDAIVEQNDTAATPILFLYARKSNNWDLKIRNISSAISYNITVEDINFKDDDNPINVKIVDKNGNEYRTIIPGDEAYLEFVYQGESKRKDAHLLADKQYLLLKVLEEDLPKDFILNYNDLKLNCYQIILKKVKNKSFFFKDIYRNKKG